MDVVSEQPCRSPTGYPFPAAPRLRLGPEPACFLGMQHQENDVFEPSRRRRVQAINITTTSGLQPTGNAMAPLLPRGLEPEVHWEKANQLLHPMAQLPALPAGLLRAAHKLALVGPTVVEYRAATLQRIEALGQKLLPLQAKWKASLHPQLAKIVGHWNMPLILTLGREAGIPDRFFGLDVSRGLQQLGRPGHSFNMPLRRRAPRCSKEELLEHAPRANARIISSVGPSGDPELDEYSFMQTQKEIESGTMLGPWPASSPPASIKVVSRRFAHWEHHGLSGKRKCRNLDEFSESGVNDTVDDYETYVPKGIETILALVVLLQRVFGNIPLEGWTSDFKSAYRQVPADPREYEFLGIAFWDPHARAVFLGILTALAFGARRAPANWGRVVLYIVNIAWYHLYVLVLDYVDDCNSVEPAFSAESGRQAWIRLCNALGVTLDIGKTSPHAATSFSSLGVMFTLASPAGVIDILPRRLVALQDEIEEILRGGVLLPGRASRLRARLGFTVIALFGRFGRAQLSPFKRRQYQSRGGYALTPVLVCTLRWWQQQLASLPRRGVPPVPSTKHVLAYSDGEGTHQVAVCVSGLGGPHKLTHSRVPSDIVTQWAGRQNIHRTEATGPLLGLDTFPDMFSGQLVLFFIDNQSALGSMKGGWSSDAHMNLITACTWARIAELRCFVWFEYVDSHANIIDRASRVQSKDDLQWYLDRGWEICKPHTPWHRLKQASE